MLALGSIRHMLAAPGAQTLLESLAGFQSWQNTRSRLLQTEGSCASATIAYEEIPAPGPPGTDPDTCVLVHGLLGSGRNWRTLSRRLVGEAYASSGRRWRVILVDQRCHGASTAVPGLHPPHNMEAAAADIARLINHRLGGHSLGGKAVLQYLRGAATGGDDFKKPQQAWVLDSPVSRAAPGARPGEADRVLDDLRCIQLPLPSRQALYKIVADQGYSVGVQQWLGSNLMPSKNSDGLVWTFDAADAVLRDVVERPPTALHIVRAEKSDRWPSREWQRLEDIMRAQEDAGHAAGGAASSGEEAGAGGRLILHTLPEAGHWLHVDNPDGLLRDILLPAFL